MLTLDQHKEILVKKFPKATILFNDKYLEININKEFVIDVLGKNDDITYFEYSKKTSRENGPAVVGIELEKKEDLAPLIKRMKALNFYGEYLNDKPNLFEFLV